MRGLVRRVRGGAVVQDRHLYTYGLKLLMRRHKVCTWCQTAVDEPKRRYWHSECIPWHSASTTTLHPSWNDPNHERRHCADCGSTAQLEIEHEISIAVAVELGPRAVMRAFSPHNLRWLCHECHVAKTRRDRLILKYLRHGMGDPPPPEPPRLPGMCL